MAHRGPDDEGIWCDYPVVIGHRRLSIIDLFVTSKQPMADKTGRYILSYNGEIYNYQDLRDQLKDMWLFVSAGDTEVLLAGMIIYGEQFVSRMEGMWAFALWDNLEKKLFLSRDRIGKKPLYYRTSGNTFICASELPALMELDDQEWEEDWNSTADYFRYGYYLPGTTAYQGIKEVLPGHFLTWTAAKKRIQSRRFWEIPNQKFQGTRNDASQVLREKIYDAVRKRMVADVEVGALLSGGIDSSLIVSVMRRRFGTDLKTFTIGFYDSTFDESQYAGKVADFFSTTHHKLELEQWDKELIKTVCVDHVGQPFADSSILPTLMVSRLASEFVKVVLSGDGSDELFSGYQRYQALTILRWYTRLPRIFRENLELLIKNIPEPVSHHSRSLLKKAHLFCATVNRFEADQPYVAPTFFTTDDLSKLIPDLAGYGHVPVELPQESQLDDIERMMRMDCLVYLPQDILVKVDRASMAHGLEVRAPFLDHEVVELAFSFPRSWHRNFLKGKRMLQDSFDSMLPRWVWTRRKQGFSVPVSRWFYEDMGDDLLEMLERIESVLNKSFVSRMYQLHIERKRDYGHHLWILYSYLLWLDRKFQAASK